MSWIFTSLPYEQRRKYDESSSCMFDFLALRFIIRRLELADVDFKKAHYKNELDEVTNYKNPSTTFRALCTSNFIQHLDSIWSEWESS